VPRGDAGASIIAEQNGLAQSSTSNEAERAQIEDFAAQDGPQRLARLEAELDAVLGPPRATIELWTLVRLCFEQHGFASRSLDVRELEASGLAELDDCVATQRVALEGTAPLGTLVRAVEELRALGEVVSLDEAHFQAERSAGEGGSELFATRVVLCFWSRVERGALQPVQTTGPDQAGPAEAGP
jgi:hypothetical protein